jgi:hypothetical protein
VLSLADVHSFSEDLDEFPIVIDKNTIIIEGQDCQRSLRGTLVLSIIASFY